VSTASDQHFPLADGIIYTEYNVNRRNLTVGKKIKDIEKHLCCNMDVLTTSFAILVAIVLSLVTRYLCICKDFTPRLYRTFRHAGLYILRPERLSVHVRHRIDFTCINNGPVVSGDIFIDILMSCNTC
jgi:hypothetical protein